MALGEIAYRAYRIIPLAGGGCRIVAHRSACFDFAPVPPPLRVLVRLDDPEACRSVVDAMWSADPEPVRPWLAWNDVAVAYWVAECDVRNASLWTAREISRSTLRELVVPFQPEVVIRVELVELEREQMRLDFSWIKHGQIAKRESIDPVSGECHPFT